MMSVVMRAVMAHAEELEKTLRADDPRLRQSSFVLCDDGSSFFIDSSFIVEHEEPSATNDVSRYWIIVLAEHYGAFVHNKNDVRTYAMFPSYTAMK